MLIKALSRKFTFKKTSDFPVSVLKIKTIKYCSLDNRRADVSWCYRYYMAVLCVFKYFEKWHNCKDPKRLQNIIDSEISDRNLYIIFPVRLFLSISTLIKRLCLVKKVRIYKL